MYPISGRIPEVDGRQDRRGASEHWHRRSCRSCHRASCHHCRPALGGRILHTTGRDGLDTGRFPDAPRTQTGHRTRWPRKTRRELTKRRRAVAVKRRQLAKRRKSQGFSQESLAERLEVDPKTIRRWESGESGPQPWLRPKLAQSPCSRGPGNASARSRSCVPTRRAIESAASCTRSRPRAPLSWGNWSGTPPSDATTARRTPISTRRSRRPVNSKTQQPKGRRCCARASSPSTARRTPTRVGTSPCRRPRPPGEQSRSCWPRRPARCRSPRHARQSGRLRTGTGRG